MTERKPVVNHTENLPESWLGKPYRSLNAWFAGVYGKKCKKIALDAGLSCPNRDGTLGRGGCIFCSAGGSGDFAVPAEEFFSGASGHAPCVAYFQAYTNTYGPVPRLRALYTAALDRPDTVGISIATRPDCLGGDVLALLADLRSSYPEKFIWIELGLQTIHEEVAAFCNRGYSLPVFEEAFSNLCDLGIPVIVHVILGLPGETPDMMRATCRYLNRIPSAGTHPFGVKLQLLHILKGTRLGDLYAAGSLSRQEDRFFLKPLSQELYTDILISCLELLHPDIVIHRVTGDGPKELLLAPRWSTDKKKVLNTLHRTMLRRGAYQGRCYHDAGPYDTV